MEFFSPGHASPTSLGGCSPLASRDPRLSTPSTAGSCPLSWSLLAGGRWPQEEPVLSRDTGSVSPCPLEKW